MALSDRIYNKFEEWRADVTRGFGGLLVAIITKGLEILLEIVELALKPVTAPLVAKINANPEVPQEIKDMLNTAQGGTSFAFAPLLLGLAGGVASAAAGSALLPGLEHMKQWMSFQDRFQVFDYQMVLAAWLRGLDFPEDIFNDLRKLGWNEFRIEIFKQLAHMPLDYRDVQSIWIRDKVKYEKWLNDLKIAGWSEERIEVLKELAHIVPPVADMVRFADFGSFDPHIIELWKEFYDAPNWIKEPMAKAGITGEWADKYWFSHWQQPGRYELGLLRARDHIDDDTVKNAYLTQGFSSFWQDLLLKLVWEPYTRVDVRRMYKVGVLDEAGVKRAYQDLGYDDEKATRLTEFTLKYYGRDEEDVEEEQEKIRELTRSDVCDGYRKGILTAAECTDLLDKLAYEPASVQFYLDREDLKKDQALKDAYAANYRRLYVTGRKDDDVVKSEMVALGFLEGEVDELLRLWYIERIRREARPSRTDLVRFLRKEIITEGTWRLEMAALGYDDQYIEWYLQDIKK